MSDKKPTKDGNLNFFQRVGRYIRQNPLKLIIGALLAAGAVAVTAFFWPVILPTFLVTLIGSIATLVTLCLLTSMTASLFTGLIHHAIDRKLQSSKDIKRKNNSPKKDQVLAQSVSQFNNHHSIINPLLETNSSEDQRQLYLFCDWLQITVPLNILKNNSAEELIAHAKLHFSIANKGIFDLFKMTKVFFEKNVHLHIQLNFSLISDLCKNSMRKLNIGKYLDLTALQNELTSIKGQLLSQLLTTGQFNFDNIKCLTSDPLQRFLSNLEENCSSWFIAQKYLFEFFTSSQQSAKTLQRLYCDVFAERIPRFNQEVERIKNVFLYFLKEKKQQYNRDLRTMKMEELAKLFQNSIPSFSQERLVTLYRELQLSHQQHLYNLAFLLHFLHISFDEKNTPQEFKKVCSETLLQDIQDTDTKLTLNCVVLFLRLAFDIKEVEKQPISKILAHFFDETKQKIKPEQALAHFVSLRFCNFIKLNEQNFISLLRKIYAEDQNALNSFDESFNLIRSEEFIKKVISPKLQAFKSFIFQTKQTTYSLMELDSMRSPQLLTCFYQLLGKMNVSDIVSTLRKFSGKDNGDVKFMLSTIQFYFQYSLPQALDSFNSEMNKHSFRNSLDSPDAFFNCRLSLLEPEFALIGPRARVK